MICPYCHAPRASRNGTRKRGSIRVQQWRCKVCGRGWQDDSILTHHTPTLTAQEMRILYDSGLTLQEVSDRAGCSRERVRQLLQETSGFTPRRVGVRKTVTKDDGKPNQ